MKTLYFECNMGAAGDMLAAALLELHPHPENIISQLNRAGIPHVAIDSEPAIKCSIKGTHFSVSVNGEHECRCDVGYESPFSEDEQSAGSTPPQAHTH
ncbi:MAG: DUF111 family protein, partial [bacterium]|nr:DUF111 family protein [bacterium]